MIWLKLTADDGKPTWVNVDAFVEMRRGASHTVLWTGHVSAYGGGDAVYYERNVKETPEEIFQMIREGQVEDVS